MSQSEQEQLIDLKRFGDWTSWSSLLILLALLPFSVISVMGVAWIPASVWASWDGSSFLRNFIVITVSYFVFLPVLFIPKFDWLQLKLAAPNSRELTPDESAYLQPAWQAVLKRVSKGGNRRWLLRVIDSAELNAYAGGGRLVIVTTAALRLLSQSELEAVLAHELGHHAGMHPVVLLARGWLVRPIGWFQWMLVKIHNGLRWFTELFTVGWFYFWMRVALFIPIIVVGLLNLIYKATFTVLQFLGRQAEHQADATAVKLGYGGALLQAFKTLSGGDGYQESDLPAVRTLWDTHPPMTQRVQRITRAIARLPNA